MSLDTKPSIDIQDTQKVHENAKLLQETELI